MKPRGLKASWRKVTNTYGFEASSPARQQENRDALRTELLDADSERVWRMFFSNMLRMDRRLHTVAVTDNFGRSVQHQPDKDNSNDD